mmetsp:Transcript_37927/g.45725  ORF Transcript_37927/g.45725 Transcript_37927/m.45725 type:complete len:122 (-) Transcript_37927:103-468(-)
MSQAPQLQHLGSGSGSGSSLREGAAADDDGLVSYELLFVLNSQPKGESREGESMNRPTYKHTWDPTSQERESRRRVKRERTRKVQSTLCQILYGSHLHLEAYGDVSPGGRSLREMDLWTNN